MSPPPHEAMAGRLRSGISLWKMRVKAGIKVNEGCAAFTAFGIGL